MIAQLLAALAAIPGTLRAWAWTLHCFVSMMRACRLTGGYKTPWWPNDDLDTELVRGKVIVITGASSGCGEEIVRCLGEVLLCRRGADSDDPPAGGDTCIYLFVRNVDKMAAVLQKLRTEWSQTRQVMRGDDDGDEVQEPIDETARGVHFIPIHCDCDDLTSVRKASEEFFSQEAARAIGAKDFGKEEGEDANATDPRPAQAVVLDVLFCNAGIMSTDLTEKTKQGFERDFRINCLAHHALVRYLSRALLAASDRHKATKGSTSAPRVVWTSSIAAFWIHPLRGAVEYYFRPLEGALRGGPVAKCRDAATAAATAASTTAAKDPTSLQNVSAGKKTAAAAAVAVARHPIFRWTRTSAYARSKLAALLSTRYLAMQLASSCSDRGRDGNGNRDESSSTPPPPVIFVSVHPGVLNTSITVVEDGWQQWVMDRLTFPAHTPPLQSGNRQRRHRRRGYSAINLLYAAFVLAPHDAHLAFLSEWCQVADVAEQGRRFGQQMQGELADLQQDLGEWMDAVVRKGNGRGGKTSGGDA